MRRSGAARQIVVLKSRSCRDVRRGAGERLPSRCRGYAGSLIAEKLFSSVATRVRSRTIINMQLDTLTAISPIDGRYRSKCEPLADYFSEFALIRYRVRVEVEYFIALCEIPLPQLAEYHSAFTALRAIYT